MPHADFEADHQFSQFRFIVPVPNHLRNFKQEPHWRNFNMI